mmetsp:Transcript_13802/g.35211  ORF Transcript_13802/g.35211 Transcript_13802/m.35211 type:complete len:280 (+) Transcript_13802:737-1576(+)
MRLSVAMSLSYRMRITFSAWSSCGSSVCRILMERSRSELVVSESSSRLYNASLYSFALDLISFMIFRIAGGITSASDACLTPADCGAPTIAASSEWSSTFFVARGRLCFTHHASARLWSASTAGSISTRLCRFARLSSSAAAAARNRLGRLNTSGNFCAMAMQRRMRSILTRRSRSGPYSRSASFSVARNAASRATTLPSPSSMDLRMSSSADVFWTELLGSSDSEWSTPRTEVTQSVAASSGLRLCLTMYWICRSCLRILLRRMALLCVANALYGVAE